MKIEIDADRVSALLRQVVEYGSDSDLSNVFAAIIFLTATDAQAAELFEELSEERLTQIGNDVAMYLADHGVTNLPI